MSIAGTATLSDTRGQEDAKEVLRNLRSHTLLFIGPPRVGRRGIARWYAALLNCANPSAEPCGLCESCTLMLHGTHPDYREIAPEALTKTGKVSRQPQLRIDDLVTREGGNPDPLGPWLELRPRFKRRVGVIDSAETLNEGAANAFLKTLEEPPSFATIILIAPSPEMVLATIVSRSAPVRFRAVDESELAYLSPPTHPLLRLGRAGDAVEAAQYRDSFDELVELVDSYLDALAQGLNEAFEAADALEKRWLAEERFELPQLLRARLSERHPVHYAHGLGAVERFETALNAYASATLAAQVLTLELRRIFSERP